MSVITSVHNPRVKLAVQLRRRRGRRQQGRIIVDGLREIARALQCGIQPVELFVSSELVESKAIQSIVDQCGKQGTPPLWVAPNVFRRLAFGERDDGVVLVARRPLATLGQIPIGETSMIAVLEKIEKPGNVGAILRSADGAGISGVVLTGGGTDLFNPNAIRASLGAIFHVPVAVASPDELHGWLAEHSISIYAAKVDGATSYDAVRYRTPGAIVLGNEADGLSERWLGPDVQGVRIPMRGLGDSLNVSVTAAILFYEATRPLGGA